MLWIILVAITPVVAIFVWYIWDTMINPKRCKCGAAGWLEFGMFVDHAGWCPAKKD